MSKVYELKEEELKALVERAGEKGVEAYRKEHAKFKNSKLKKAKEIFEAYRKIKKSLEDESEFSKEEKIELRWSFIEDLMGNVKGIADKSDRTINDQEKKRQENLYCIECVDRAAALYKKECYDSGNVEAIRRYNMFEQRYLAEEESTIKDISFREKISEKSVYREIRKATRIIAIYLLGVDF